MLKISCLLYWIVMKNKEFKRYWKWYHWCHFLRMAKPSNPQTLYGITSHAMLTAYKQSAWLACYAHNNIPPASTTHSTTNKQSHHNHVNNYTNWSKIGIKYTCSVVESHSLLLITCLISCCILNYLKRWGISILRRFICRGISIW